MVAIGQYTFFEILIHSEHFSLVYHIVGIDIYMYLSAYFVLFQDSIGQGGHALGRGPPPHIGQGAPTAHEPPLVGYVDTTPPTVSLYLYILYRWHKAKMVQVTINR